jgi:hypothetical protein
VSFEPAALSAYQAFVAQMAGTPPRQTQAQPQTRRATEVHAA